MTGKSVPMSVTLEATDAEGGFMRIVSSTEAGAVHLIAMTDADLRRVIREEIAAAQAAADEAISDFVGGIGGRHD